MTLDNLCIGLELEVPKNEILKIPCKNEVKDECKYCDKCYRLKMELIILKIKLNSFLKILTDC